MSSHSTWSEIRARRLRGLYEPGDVIGPIPMEPIVGTVVRAIYESAGTWIDFTRDNKGWIATGAGTTEGARRDVTSDVHYDWPSLFRLHRPLVVVRV